MPAAEVVPENGPEEVESSNRRNRSNKGKGGDDDEEGDEGVDEEGK